MNDIFSKFRGCLLGLAIGDAIGYPIEGMKAGYIKQLFGEIEGFADNDKFPLENFFKWRASGIYSDDTQQSLAIADVLIMEEGFIKESLAEIFIRLSDEGEQYQPQGLHRGAEKDFIASVLKMKANPKNLFSCGHPSASNGAAARIVPMGLYYRDSKEELIRNVVEASLLTHNDPCAIAAAAALARSVSVMINLSPRENVPINEFCSDIKDITIRAENFIEDNYWKFLDKDKRILSKHTFSDSLSILEPILRENDDDIARSTIIKEANRHNPDFPITSCNQGYAPASVIASLYYGFKYKNFNQGLLTAINEGKDADTVGAMTGALLGAHLGIEAIPTEWISNLKGSEQISLRADALLTNQPDYMKWIDLVENEKQLMEYISSEKEKFISSHKKEIEKIKEKHEKKEALKAKLKEERTKIENLAFAPPPDVWLKDKATKLEKLARSKKRITWKETRRQKEKEGWKKK